MFINLIYGEFKFKNLSALIKLYVSWFTNKWLFNLSMRLWFGMTTVVLALLIY